MSTRQDCSAAKSHYSLRLSNPLSSNVEIYFLWSKTFSSLSASHRSTFALFCVTLNPLKATRHTHRTILNLLKIYHTVNRLRSFQSLSNSLLVTWSVNLLVTLVTRSLDHLVTWSSGHLVTLSLCHLGHLATLVTWSLC